VSRFIYYYAECRGAVVNADVLVDSLSTGLFISRR